MPIDRGGEMVTPFSCWLRLPSVAPRRQRSRLDGAICATKPLLGVVGLGLGGAHMPPDFAKPSAHARIYLCNSLAPI